MSGGEAGNGIVLNIIRNFAVWKARVVEAGVKHEEATRGRGVVADIERVLGEGGLDNERMKSCAWREEILKYPLFGGGQRLDCACNICKCEL